MKPTTGPGSDPEIQLFDLAPVSLWLQDLSDLKARLDDWRAAGVTDLRGWLGDPEHLLTCQTLIRIVRVNHRTLTTYEAVDEAELFAHIPAVFNDASAAAFVEVLCQLWEGRTQVRLVTQNRTVRGRVIDVSYAGQILPGHESSWARYLISVEDITQREELRRRESGIGRRIADLFEHSPVPMLIRDETRLAQALKALRAAGILDLAAHLAAHPRWLSEAEASLRIVDANRPALALFGVADRAALVRHLVGGPGQLPRHLFREDVEDIWAGNAPRHRDVSCFSVDGRELHLKMQCSQVPGDDEGTRFIQIALTDIGDNKRSEARFEVLSLTDPLTGLLNRAGYIAELNRLDDGRCVPTSVIVADLNELKAINDHHGHDAGDDVICRFGGILECLAPVSARLARIGGDEFVILLPDSDTEDAAAFVHRILDEIEAANRSHPKPISVSLGFDTWGGDGPLKAVVSRADARMYAAKRRHRSSRLGEHSLGAGFSVPSSTRH